MDQLINTPVMVHPELTHDPVNQQRNIGLINHIVYENDEVYVRFKPDITGVYSADALLLLRPPAQILASLKAGIEAMDRRDIIELLNIYLLQESGQPDAIQEAMYMPIFNDALWEKALISLQDWIDQGLSHGRAKDGSNNIIR
jgi:hypothetical protein